MCADARYRGTVDLELLERTLAGEPAYRAAQVWGWAARGAASYGEMTNVPAALRGSLEQHVPFSSLTVQPRRWRATAPLKVLFHTHDGHPVEAVLMRYRDGRRSACLSSQSGCPLTCTFCATGAMQFGRNLTAERDPRPGAALPPDRADRPRRLHGHGRADAEPRPVLAAARRLPDLGVTHRRTTISTVGWLPGLTRFIDEVEEPIRLALSLHAPADALRSRLMPVNDRFPLEDVLAECAATSRCAAAVSTSST